MCWTLNDFNWKSRNKNWKKIECISLYLFTISQTCIKIVTFLEEKTIKCSSESWGYKDDFSIKRKKKLEEIILNGNWCIEFRLLCHF